MLVGYNHNHSSSPIIYTIDRDGRRDETLFTFSDAGLMNLVDVAASRTGEIAVIGSAYTSDGRATTFVARIATDRQHQTITRTWPYCPMVVTFAPDGTLWTIGHSKDNDNTTVLAYNVLQRFDASGRMLGSTSLPVKGNRTQETSGLRSSRDRVGWLTRDGEYLELSLNGSEMARYDGPEVASDLDITGLAMSDDNDVVIGRFGHGKADFLALDRETRSWSQLSLPKEYVPIWAGVHGFDGTNLVTNSKNGTLRRFRPQ